MPVITFSATNELSGLVITHVQVNLAEKVVGVLNHFWLFESLLEMRE